MEMRPKETDSAAPPLGTYPQKLPRSNINLVSAVRQARVQILTQPPRIWDLDPRLNSREPPLLCIRDSGGSTRHTRGCREDCRG